MTDLIVEKLAPIDFVKALNSLAGLLHSCVEDGASIGFLMPFTLEEAQAYWTQLEPPMRNSQRILVVARTGDAILGSGQLNFATPFNQPHRCEIAKLMVHPLARRKGIAKKLVGRLEREALQARKKLITLDTRSGDSAEYLYKELGYLIAGSIPRYCVSSDGTFDDTTIFYKEL